jgi:leucine efflux protein
MSFYGVTDIWTYALGALGIVLLPGPNSMFVLAVAGARGVKAGYQAATGVFVGDAVLMLLTAMGAATLLHTYPALFVVVKYAGAAYLAWLGVSLIRSTLRQSHAPVAAAAENTSNQLAAPAAHPFRRALLISLLNPKAILFLLSFFVQFIDPSYPLPAVPFLILSAIVMLFSALYLSALIVGGAHLAQAFRARRRLSAGLARGVGVLFVGFGAKLATASL